MPTTELAAGDLADGGIDVLTLLVKCGLCQSKSDARRNVQQGGVTANDEKVEDIAKTFTEDELRAGVISAAARRASIRPCSSKNQKRKPPRKGRLFVLQSAACAVQAALYIRASEA